jgi:hypothetical protein
MIHKPKPNLESSCESSFKIYFLPSHVVVVHLPHQTKSSLNPGSEAIGKKQGHL